MFKVKKPKIVGSKSHEYTNVNILFFVDKPEFIGEFYNSLLEDSFSDFLEKIETFLIENPLHALSREKWLKANILKKLPIIEEKFKFLSAKEDQKKVRTFFDFKKAIEFDPSLESVACEPRPQKSSRPMRKPMPKKILKQVLMSADIQAAVAYILPGLIGLEQDKRTSYAYSILRQLILLCIIAKPEELFPEVITNNRFHQQFCFSLYKSIVDFDENIEKNIMRNLTRIHFGATIVFFNPWFFQLRMSSWQSKCIESARRIYTKSTSQFLMTCKHLDDCDKPALQNQHAIQLLIGNEASILINKITATPNIIFQTAFVGIFLSILSCIYESIQEPISMDSIYDNYFYTVLLFFSTVSLCFLGKILNEMYQRNQFIQQAEEAQKFVLHNSFVTIEEQKHVILRRDPSKIPTLPPQQTTNSWYSLSSIFSTPAPSRRKGRKVRKTPSVAEEEEPFSSSKSIKPKINPEIKEQELREELKLDGNMILREIKSTLNTYLVYHIDKNYGADWIKELLPEARIIPDDNATGIKRLGKFGVFGSREQRAVYELKQFHRDSSNERYFIPEETRLGSSIINCENGLFGSHKTRTERFAIDSDTGKLFVNSGRMQ